mmetsp:Transcript_4242/g.5988  ORF Transcript_4242/g.5988 Transcript_4242/m.5988 type:complete len:139 (+) Transcript_4242:1121-1537(+)
MKNFRHFVMKHMILNKNVFNKIIKQTHTLLTYSFHQLNQYLLLQSNEEVNEIAQTISNTILTKTEIPPSPKNPPRHAKRPFLSAFHEWFYSLTQLRQRRRLSSSDHDQLYYSSNIQENVVLSFGFGWCSPLTYTTNRK